MQGVAVPNYHPFHCWGVNKPVPNCLNPRVIPYGLGHNAQNGENSAPRVYFSCFSRMCKNVQLPPVYAQGGECPDEECCCPEV